MFRTHLKWSNESFSSLWTERTCIHFCAQHLMQVMNCSVAQHVHSGLSLCQQRKLLCIYVWLNTWCRWWAIMDITLCAAFSTDGTTLCCTHISNSSQSTLKNIHVVKTCPYDDVYYDLILACSIYVKQILLLITLMMIVHGFSCTKNIQKITWQITSKCSSVLFAPVQKVQIKHTYHIKNHMKCTFCCV